jgi:hypothetical protein
VRGQTDLPPLNGGRLDRTVAIAAPAAASNY